jgi:hypothetical protein
MESVPSDGLKVRWRKPVGLGWSGPVVVQGRVFLSDALLTKPSAKERLHCFEEASGNLLWSYAYEVTPPEWVFVPDQGQGPAATPIAMSRVPLANSIRSCPGVLGMCSFREASSDRFR